MLAKPTAGKRTPGQNCQGLGGRSVDRGAHEKSADAAPAEYVWYLGMHDDELARFIEVDELGNGPVVFKHEAMPVGHVAHLHDRPVGHDDAVRLVRPTPAA